MTGFKKNKTKQILHKLNKDKTLTLKTYWQAFLWKNIHGWQLNKWVAWCQVINKCPLSANTKEQSVPTHTHTHISSPHRPLPLRYALPPLSPPVAKQHVSCADTHLPSGFSALNLVLIANWVGEQADAGWMRSRLPRLRLWPWTRLSAVKWQRQSDEKQRHTCKTKHQHKTKFRLSVFCNLVLEAMNVWTGIIIKKFGHE